MRRAPRLLARSAQHLAPLARSAHHLVGRGAPLCALPRPRSTLLARDFAASPADQTPQAAVERLHGVMLEAAESSPETFVATVDADGVLTVDLGDKGTYSMQAHDGRLLVFSPISGPCYYEFDAGNKWWSAPDDGHLLDEKLVREMMHITSVYLNL